MSRRALVLGCAGQDGSYLCDILISRGFDVHGLYRHTSNTPDSLWRIAHLAGKVTLHEGDVLDASSIGRVIKDVQPEWILNEADQDSVGYSKHTVGYSADVTSAAVGRMLEVVAQIDPSIRWFQPLSSTMFGDDPPPPQDESTPLRPASPYAAAKCGAWHWCRYFREQKGMFVSCGILHNHDSVRRRSGYLLQTIARGAVAIARGEQETIALGRPDRYVDVGHAPEFMEAAVRMLEQDAPDDFVVATGRANPIAYLVEAALAEAGVENPKAYQARLARSPEHYTPGPQPLVVGDAGKAKRVLGWEAKSDAADVVRMLARHFKERA